MKAKKGEHNYEKWVPIVDFVDVFDEDKRDWLIGYFQELEDRQHPLRVPELDAKVKVGDRYLKYAHQDVLDRTECYVSHVLGDGYVRVNDLPDFSGFSTVTPLSDLVRWP